MVHVPERFGQEFEAAGREHVSQRHGAGGIRRGLVQGDRSGEKRARLRGAHVDRRHGERDREGARHRKRKGADASVVERQRERQPAVERGGHVVGMPFETDRLAEELLRAEALPHPVIREREPRHDRGGAGAQAARDGDRGMNRERDRGHRLLRDPEEVPVRSQHRVPVRIDGELAPLAGAADREARRNSGGDGLEGEPERESERIEAGTEVRGGGGNDRPPALGLPRAAAPRAGARFLHSRMNRRRALGSASTFSITSETATARSGSLSPCPVTVHTMV